MAPRETRLESSQPARLSAESAQRLLQSLQDTAQPPPERRSGPKSQPPPAPAADLPLAGVTAKDQADVLVQAAREGAPFCEECRAPGRAP